MATGEQYFTFDSATGKITGYDVTGGLEIEIPSTIGDVEVKIIGEGLQAKNLTSVIIPNTVVELDYYAFLNNKIKQVKLSEGLKIIRNTVFQSNRLVSVVIPNSVISIGDNAFRGNSICSLVLSENITQLGYWTFANNNLKTVIIPNSVTYIHSSSFYSNPLISITIGSNVNIVDNNSMGTNGASFKAFYDIEKKAGLYEFKNGNWYYSPINLHEGKKNRYSDSGNVNLTYGNEMIGYYGKYTGICTGQELIDIGEIPYSEKYSPSDTITWLKFTHNYKTLFIADKKILTTTWNNLNTAGIISGKVIEINGIKYILRIITGANSNPATTKGENNSNDEYTSLIVHFAPHEVDSNCSNSVELTANISSTNINNIIIRGGSNAIDYFTYASIIGIYGYRPVLEVL